MVSHLPGHRRRTTPHEYLFSRFRSGHTQGRAPPRGRGVAVELQGRQIRCPRIPTRVRPLGPTTSAPRRVPSDAPPTRPSPPWRTTELYVYLLAVAGVLIASAVVDAPQDGQGFGAERAWFFVTLLTIGYLVSRGLAKAGSRSIDDRRD